MNFQEAIQTCFKKYADFNGRASRSEYWWWTLFNLILGLISSIVLGDMTSGLVSLALLLPNLAVGARRLHDIGKSGWFLLLYLLPIIGWLLLLFWAVQPSGEANEFGEPAAVTA